MVVGIRILNQPKDHELTERRGLVVAEKLVTIA
jgi:hypothetical protein